MSGRRVSHLHLSYCVMFCRDADVSESEDWIFIHLKVLAKAQTESVSLLNNQFLDHAFVKDQIFVQQALDVLNYDLRNN